MYYIYHGLEYFTYQESLDLDSSVGRATGCGFHSPVSIPGSAHGVQTVCGAHLASYPVDTGVVKLSSHFHLVPRSRKVELYLNSLICLHVIVHNYAQGHLYHAKNYNENAELRLIDAYKTSMRQKQHGTTHHNQRTCTNCGLLLSVNFNTLFSDFRVTF
jgi:hypothetical protein